MRVKGKTSDIVKVPFSHLRLAKHSFSQERPPRSLRSVGGRDRDAVGVGGRGRSLRWRSRPHGSLGRGPRSGDHGGYHGSHYSLLNEHCHYLVITLEHSERRAQNRGTLCLGI